MEYDKKFGMNLHDKKKTNKQIPTCDCELFNFWHLVSLIGYCSKALDLLFLLMLSLPEHLEEPSE